MSVRRQERWDRRELVEPVLDPTRFDETWSAIEERMDRRATRPRGRAVTVGAVVLAVAAAVALAVTVPGAATPWMGTTLATAAERATVRLPEGSIVDAEPRTELVRVRESADEVRLALRSGAASFDVVRNPDRLFTVEAGDVEVRVVGTAFQVARVGQRVRVTVERGAVDVRRGEELVRLRAGDEWEDEASVTEVAPVATVEETAAEPAPPEDVDIEPREPHARRLTVTPDTLFQQAGDARRAGDAREAARLYGRLVGRFPRNDRAPLAAFELGRIRLDQLGDPRGAAAAFQKALALGGGPFSQDARARLVEAHAKAGNDAGCRRAQEGYLSRYPRGRHTDDVTRACE